MSDEPEDFDDFDDEEEDDEALPVLGPDGRPQRSESKARHKGRRFRGRGGRDLERKGNTSAADLPAARSRNIADAQGKTTFADPGADDWRQDLANKDHGKAAAKLSSSKLTHNSGSGFGLA